jgi:hypothetical protein
LQAVGMMLFGSPSFLVDFAIFPGMGMVLDVAVGIEDQASPLYLH